MTRLGSAFQRPIEVSAEHEASAQRALDDGEPEVIRRLLLATASEPNAENQASPLVLTHELDAGGHVRFPQLDSAGAAVAHLYDSKRRLLALPAVRIAEVEQKAPAELVGLRARLIALLGPSLQTPQALTEVDRFLVAVNDIVDKALRKQGKIARSHRTDALRGFDTIAELLTLGVEQPRGYLERARDRRAAARGISKQVVERKIHERAEARDRRDFATADALRAELTKLGVELLESATGTEWTVI